MLTASARTRSRTGTGAGQQATLAAANEHGGWDWPRTLAVRGADALQMQHLRRKAVQPSTARLHCVVLDCSASMVTSGALARAKGVLLDLFSEAYQHRDHIALICFGGDGVQLRMPPGKATHWNDDWVLPIGGGGGTPLAQGLHQASDVLAQHCGARSPMQGWLWLMTDARTRELPAKPAHADEIRVMDFDGGRVALHRAKQLADAWDVPYLQG